MNKILKKTLSIILVIIMIVTSVPFAFAAEEGNVVILYTNDVHCIIDDYPALAAYRAELISQGNTVITVDAGDAIQGEVVGTLTQGKAVVDIMSAAGYDYAVPGNHEFDYGLDVLLDYAQNEADYKYISSNFCDLRNNESVFAPYYIEDISEDMQIAFVGISTPDTITSSSPEYFKDEYGNFIYGFPWYPGGMTNEALYGNVQKSVDSAIAEGADIVIAVGHLGIIGSTEGWKSTDVIANTSGIDYLIDAHSHETTVSATYKNKNNEDVFITSTGEKFANFGVLTISGDNVSFELVNPDDVDVETMSADAKTAYNTVKAKVDGYNDDVAYLFEEIGTSEANLIIYDDNGNRIVRNRETNAGDFVADAYRAVTGADVAIANGGGIRAEVEIGGVSRKTLMDVNAYNNEMCVIEVTGQQLVDVLEHGARRCPALIGGFFQVSGITFEIHTYRETPVVTDQLDNFIEMDETKERRVQNVYVGDEPIDLEKTYTLAGSQYVLTKGGDGLTMLEDVTVVQQEGLPCDSEMLIKYFTENLGGNISAEQYGNPNGDGRITIIDEDPDNTEYDYKIQYGETITVSAPNYDSDEFAYIKFVPEKDGKYILESDADEDIDPICELYDSDMAYLDGNDDCHGLNFCMEYDFTAGETYYFAVAAYYQEAEYDVTLVCGHTYEDGTCTVCGNICDHTKADFLGFCLCGEVFFGADIADGDKLEHDTAAFINEAGWYRFVPEESGVYYIESFTEPDVSGDALCDLYDANGEWLKSNDDNEESLDFRLIYNFEAGETYYFEVKNYDADVVFNIKLSRATHTADDGSEHSLEFVAETESDCIEHGYTEGLYCPDCDEYIWGHEEKELSEIHIDDDWDDICDVCGEEIVYEEIPDEEEPDDDGNDGGEGETPINFFRYIISMIMDFFNRIISFLTSLFK